MNQSSLAKLSVNQLLLVLACYFTCVFNYPFLQGWFNAVINLAQYNPLFLASVPVLLVCLLCLVFCFVSFKYLLKPALITLTFISAMIFYGTWSYGVVFDYGMVQNSVETNSAELLSYINAELLCVLVLTGLLPCYLIYRTDIDYQSWYLELLARTRLVIICSTALAAILLAFYQDYAAVARTNKQLQTFIIPTQYLSSGFNYAKHHYYDQQLTFSTLDPNPKDISPNEKEVLVIVVGETARAKNFSLNGYQVATNQHTQAEGVTSFKYMYSCGTATAVSVPCMFSSLSRNEFDRGKADHQQNLLDLVSLAGVDVLWLDNNGCKNVCDRVATISIEQDQTSPLCDGEYCQDEILLPHLANKLANLSSNKTIIVLHLMGSHGPTYFKRYPEQHKLFSPDCPRSDIQNCSEQELINTYDNTIAYTDFVLGKVIEQLKTLGADHRKSMVYVSDHGESLGESGAYLHGFPYAFAPKEQKHIPMLVWREQDREFDQCLKGKAQTLSYSHDHFYHSILGLLSIQSSTYQPNLDIFSTCLPRANNTGLQLANSGE